MKTHLLVTRLLLALSCAPLLSTAQTHDASMPRISFRINDITYQLDYAMLDQHELTLAKKMHIIRHIIQLSGQKNIAQSYAFARSADQKGNPLGSYILALQSRYGIGMDESLDRYIFRLKLAADKNYAPALYELSVAYDHGIGVPADLRTSQRYLLRAAELGNPDALQQRALTLIQEGNYEGALPDLEKAAQAGLAEASFQLGICYAHGFGGPADMQRCIAALTQAAEQGHLRAMGALSVIYQEGLGVPSSPEKVKHWDTQLSLAINYDDQQSCASAAYCYACRLAGKILKTDAEALSILQRAAKKEHAVVDYMLAHAHYAGLGQPEPNPTEAFTLMEKAAKAGYLDAIYALGLYYLHGTGCTPDQTQAVAWLERAAEQDHPGALSKLAIGYWGDDNRFIKLPRDYKKSLELNLRAAKLGSPIAQNHAAYMLYRNMGRRGSKEEIQYWFEQAGENNLPIALFTLGERALIEHEKIKQKLGHYTKESRQKMYNYYRRAAELGVVMAMERLADCHEGFYGFEPDIDQHVYWLELGHEFGNTSCSNDLADLYIKGKGVKKDTPRALAIYERNIPRRNGQHAAARLAFIYYKGLYGVPRNLVKAIEYYERSRIPLTGHLTKQEHFHALLENSAGELQSPMRALELMQHEFNNLRGTEQYLVWIALNQLLKPLDAAYPRLDAAAQEGLLAQSQRGNQQAQYQLAVSLLRGDTGKVDAAAARAHLEALAKVGHLDALIDLSLYAMYGLTEPPDNKKALEYIKRFAQNKSEKAQLFAGLIAYRDLTVPEMRACAPHLQAAAAMGNLDALYIQHKKCSFIQPELRAHEAAMNLQLAKQGHLGALVNVCFFYQQNFKESLPILEKFATMGNGGAQYKLNCIYRFGMHSIPKDLQKADHWLELSAKNGYFEALKDMRLLKRL